MWSVDLKLAEVLGKLNGKQLADVRKELVGVDFELEPGGRLAFVHVQGSPGADPASVLRLVLPAELLGLRPSDWDGHGRVLATEDFVLRAFQQACADPGICVQHRGDDGSGRWQPLRLPQQVLRWNAINVRPNRSLDVLLRISLPSSNRGNSLYGDDARDMLARELPAIVASVERRVRERKQLEKWQAVVSDYLWLQRKLPELGLVAFVGNGAVLPRESGVSDLPLRGPDVVEFRAPPELEVIVDLPCSGRVRGMGIEEGVTAIVGGGFHGKSTLLEALCKAVYPHIPGDGRERVVCRSDAVYVRAEDGRAVHKVNISSFIRKLPKGRDTAAFTTQNASGSTSQAAALVEAVCAGAKLLMFDEDTSATNFLVRDDAVRALVPGDPIVPLLDRLDELKNDYGVSVVIVVGSNSAYFGVADRVVEMHEYLPRDVTEKAKKLVQTKPRRHETALKLEDNRSLREDNFSPDYVSPKRRGGAIYRVKVRRGEPSKVEMGEDLVDLSANPAVAAQEQVLAIGRLLPTCRDTKIHVGKSPSELASALAEQLDAQGLESIQGPQHLFLAMPRSVDIAAAINRLRNLSLE